MQKPLAVLVLSWFFLLHGCDSNSSSSSSNNEPAGQSTAQENEELTPSEQAPPTRLTNFDDGNADGWAITSADVPFISTDGNCGSIQVESEPGFICADANEDGGTSYFVAPAEFLGDINVFSNLNFDLIANGGTYFNSGFGFDGDVVITNGVSTASITFTEEQEPDNTFRTYIIPLNENGNWVVDDGSPLSTVFQNITELRIRAEYGTGPDNSGLDNIFFD